VKVKGKTKDPDTEERGMEETGVKERSLYRPRTVPTNQTNSSLTT
jgi:hypothetical protein